MPCHRVGGSHCNQAPDSVRNALVTALQLGQWEITSHLTSLSCHRLQEATGWALQQSTLSSEGWASVLLTCATCQEQVIQDGPQAWLLASLLI